ncbi:MAG: ParB/RepB/Spo0J family partition protein [Planctomycetota bacterium]
MPDPTPPSEGFDQSTISLPIQRLDPHPLNSNVMPKALLDKLAKEIQRTGLYPPVIVRPIGGRYQVLDGHHRVQVLRRLGHPTVQANVWPVDDEQAMLFLASLNRMRGEDDPHKRAALLDRLRQRMGVSELAQRLPEDVGRVKKMLALNAAPPAPKPPQPINQMPVCLTFFVLPSQRQAVEQRLRKQGGTREAALLALLQIPEEST